MEFPWTGCAILLLVSDMLTFLLGALASWFVFSLILFLVSQFSHDKFVTFWNDRFLILITLPASAPMLAGAYAVRYIVQFCNYTRHRFKRI